MSNDFFSPKERLKRKLIWLFRYHKYDILPIFYFFLLVLLLGLVLTGAGYSLKIVEVPYSVIQVTSTSDYNTEVNKIFIHEQEMNKIAEEMKMTSPVGTVR